MHSFVASFFSSEISQIIQKGKYVDVRVSPNSLVKQFSDKKGRTILTNFLKNPQNEQNYLRILSVLGIALIYSDECYQVILANLEVLEFGSSWLSKQILALFAKWVLKCCETYSLFKQIKKKTSKNQTVMDRIPYCINLLKELLNIIKKIPIYARYYNPEDRNLDSVMLSQILLALNNMIYSHLKISFQIFLQTEKYEKIIIHKEIIKWIYNEILPDMNENIKSITLNRHLGFYHKGIAVKLIYPDQYTSKANNILNELLGKERCKSKSTEYCQSLQSQIFPDDGSFDQDLFYYTLEENCRSNKKKDIYKMLDRSLTTQNIRQYIKMIKKRLP